MKNNLWNKRIPTLLGLTLIIISIGITSILVKSGIIFISKASPSQTPQNVQITNISDSSITIAYTTDDSVLGSVNFGNNKNLGQTALDERDQLANTISPHKTHSITITNLKPSTNYFFTITSGQNTFLNNDQPFQVATGSTIAATPSSQLPLIGNILMSDGTKPTEAIIYVSIEGSQIISTLIKPDGSYILPLNSLRTNDLSSYFNFTDNSIIKLSILGNSLRSNILLSKSQVNSIPTITLSKDYDFTTSTQPVASVSAQPLNSDLFSTLSAQSSSKSQSPQILSPKKDEGYSDQQPLFKGKGLPNETVKILIHSTDVAQTTITADSYGNWSYRPSQPLSVGDHTITIQTPDSSGIVKTITQSFTVYASGTQVNQSATPSATLTPSPTLTPTLMPTLIPTTTPIITVIPQLSPTLIPQSTTTANQTKGGLAPTGNSTIIGIGVVGIVITIVGGILLF